MFLGTRLYCDHNTIEIHLALGIHSYQQGLSEFFFHGALKSMGTRGYVNDASYFTQLCLEGYPYFSRILINAPRVQKLHYL